MTFVKRPPRHLFNSVVTVQAITQTATGVGGGFTQTWPNTLVSIQARIQPQVAAFSVQQGTERERKKYTVFIAPGQAVVAGYRMTFTDFEGTARTVLIDSTKDNQLGGVVLRCDCTEVLD